MSSPTSRRSGPSQAPGFAGPENSGAFRTIEINLEATWVKLGVGSWSFPKGDSNQRKVTTSPTDNSKASVPMAVGRMSLTGFEGKHFVMAGRTRIQTATKSIEVMMMRQTVSTNRLTTKFSNLAPYFLALAMMEAKMCFAVPSKNVTSAYAVCTGETKT